LMATNRSAAEREIWALFCSADAAAALAFASLRCAPVLLMVLLTAELSPPKTLDTADMAQIKARPIRRGSDLFSNQTPAVIDSEGQPLLSKPVNLALRA